MEKLKELWKKLDLKTAAIGGAIVVTTSLGTCQLMGPDEGVSEEAPTEAEEAAVEEAPAEEGSTEEEAEAEAPE